MKINRIGVLSIAKVGGAIYAVLGVVAGVIMTLFAFVGMAFSGAEGNSILLSLASIIVLPILYGLAGFVGAAVTAFLFNLVVERIGGVEIETSD